MQNNCKNLLKAKSPTVIQKRTANINRMADNNDFAARISLETPVVDYKKLLKEKVQMDTIVSDDELEENYKKVSEAARNMIWKFLFAEQPAKKEQLQKAAELLEAHKPDACFYGPWDYNDWIVKVRDELLKREMFDFWRETVVRKALGPCWAKDSDYFDNMEDPAPAAFYKFAGCMAPFSTENAEPVNEPNDFDATLSLETPVADYKKLMKEKVQMDIIVSDDELQENYKKVSEAARNMIWKLLFAEQPAKKEHLQKAAELLQTHRRDACFYAPWDYNDWIVNVRDELLKREMFDFWRDVVVKQELGPCWAKDSDLYDDMNDPAPAAFYKFAGCVAPFSTESKEPVNSNFDATLSAETPLADYKKLIKEKVQVDEYVEDEVLRENYKKIAEAARNMIWNLLFTEQPAKKEQLQKAAELLEAHKSDACFYYPWGYNDWIVKVRDELLKRKMFDFWRDVVVKQELGPCWARDSDYFDDMDDTEPEEFYKHAGCVAPFSKKNETETTNEV